jgi:NADH:ubiquinone oxidoreductase subunit E
MIMVVTICIGSSCHLKGSREIVHTLETLIKEYKVEDQVQLTGSFCMGECVKGVCVKVDDKSYSLNPENTREFFMQEVLECLPRED